MIELRSYFRVRERQLDYAVAHIQHKQKALTFMNIQLNLVVSDMTGVTGMRIIRAIVEGVLATLIEDKEKPTEPLAKAKHRTPNNRINCNLM